MSPFPSSRPEGPFAGSEDANGKGEPLLYEAPPEGLFLDIREDPHCHPVAVEHHRPSDPSTATVGPASTPHDSGDRVTPTRQNQQPPRPPSRART